MALANLGLLGTAEGSGPTFTFSGVTIPESSPPDGATILFLWMIGSFSDSFAGRPSAYPTISDDATMSRYYRRLIFPDGKNKWMPLNTGFSDVSIFADGGSAIVDNRMMVGLVLNGIGPGDTITVEFPEALDEIKLYLWGYTGCAMDNSSVTAPHAPPNYSVFPGGSLNYVFTTLGFMEPWSPWGFVSSDFAHGYNNYHFHRETFGGEATDGVAGGGGPGQNIFMGQLGNPSTGTPSAPWGFDRGDYFFLAAAAPSQDDHVLSVFGDFWQYVRLDPTPGVGLQFIHPLGLTTFIEDFNFFGNLAGNALMAEGFALGAIWDPGGTGPPDYGAVDVDPQMYAVNATDIAGATNSSTVAVGLIGMSIVPGLGPVVPFPETPPGVPGISHVYPMCATRRPAARSSRRPSGLIVPHRAGEIVVPSRVGTAGIRRALVQ